MATIDIPTGPSMTRHRWSGRTSCGGTIGGVTVPHGSTINSIFGSTKVGRVYLVQLKSVPY